MRVAMIGCMVMNREISHLVANSKNIVRVWWVRQGLHDTPDILRSELQRYIDEIEEENTKLRSTQQFDCIALAYGLCSNGVIGLRTKTLPLIIPRCDDCISLFLGSADRYRELFKKMPGIYWYNRGWVENAFVPSKENYAMLREEYVEDYGEENADYLMECTNGWMTNYKNCGYITNPLFECAECKELACQAAKDFGWEYVEVEGSMHYFEALVNGPWDDERFLTCPPKSKVISDFSHKKFRSIPCEIA